MMTVCWPPTNIIFTTSGQMLQKKGQANMTSSQRDQKRDSWTMVHIYIVVL